MSSLYINIDKTFREWPELKLFCHIWFNDTLALVVSNVTALEPLASGSYREEYPHDGDKRRLMDPALLSCPVPPSHQSRVPESVSLLQTECLSQKWQQTTCALLLTGNKV